MDSKTASSADTSIIVREEDEDDKALSLEENSSDLKIVSEGDIIVKTPTNVSKTGSKMEVQVGVKTPKSGQPKPKVSRKLPEIKWKNVKRMKRNIRFYYFESTSEDDKDERQLIKAADSQKVPAVINGRKPFLVVPGVDYDLGEGEGLVDTEEDLIEIRLAGMKSMKWIPLFVML